MYLKNLVIPVAAKRAREGMMGMTKIGISAIERAQAGKSAA